MCSTRSRSRCLYEPQRYERCALYFSHCRSVEFADTGFKSVFIKCAQLFEQYDGIFGKSELSGAKLDMGRKLCFCYPARYGAYYNGGRVSVADVVLNNKNGTYSA